MNQKVREPFLRTRMLNFLLGIIILALVVVVIVRDSNTEIFQMLIFALAAIENFIGATVSFSEKKRVRGNVYVLHSFPPASVAFVRFPFPLRSRCLHP